MPDMEKVVKGLTEIYDEAYDRWVHRQYTQDKLLKLIDETIPDALALLREQEPRLMTLDEVIRHYSLPPVFVDDLSAQEDYLEDIAPLYFDFPVADSFAVHWRGDHSVSRYLDDWKASYGEKWRCWTARPTDEQRKAVKWDESN